MDSAAAASDDFAGEGLGDALGISTVTRGSVVLVFAVFFRLAVCFLEVEAAGGCWPGLAGDVGGTPTATPEI